MHFPRHDRRAFQIAEPLRMALMLSEAGDHFGKPLETVVGETLDWQALSQYDSRQSLTNYLYRQVQSLAQTLPYTKEGDNPKRLLGIPQH